MQISGWMQLFLLIQNVPAAAWEGPHVHQYSSKSAHSEPFLLLKTPERPTEHKDMMTLIFHDEADI